MTRLAIVKTPRWKRRARWTTERPPFRFDEGNGLVDDPHWCGHAFVDLSTWRCSQCERTVTAATRERLTAWPTRAPEGHVWVLQELGGNGDECGLIVGVFTDRARIARILVQDSIIGAAALREYVRRLTWYQGAFNPDYLEAWGTDEDDDEVRFDLRLFEIDSGG